MDKLFSLPHVMSKIVSSFLFSFGFRESLRLRLVNRMLDREVLRVWFLDGTVEHILATKSYSEIKNLYGGSILWEMDTLAIARLIEGKINSSRIHGHQTAAWAGILREAARILTAADRVPCYSHPTEEDPNFSDAPHQPTFMVSMAAAHFLGLKRVLHLLRSQVQLPSDSTECVRIGSATSVPVYHDEFSRARCSCEWAVLTACFFGRISTVATLVLGPGHEAFLRDQILTDCLQMSVSRGHEELVKFLLLQGVDINAEVWRTIKGVAIYSILSEAVVSSHLNMVDLLLEPAYGFDTSSELYKYAIEAAAEYPKELWVKKHLVMLLFDKATFAEDSSLLYWAFHRACEDGNEELVGLLLDNGGFTVNGHGGASTGLQQAAWKGYSGIVRIILDRGKWENRVLSTEYGDKRRSLCHGVSQGHVEVVEMFRNFNSKIFSDNGKVFCLEVVFNRAARYGQVQVMRQCLEWGIDLAFSSGGEQNVGTTALVSSITSSFSNESTVRFLLELGASPPASMNSGRLGKWQFRPSFEAVDALLREYGHKGLEVED